MKKSRIVLPAVYCIICILVIVCQSVGIRNVVLKAGANVLMLSLMLFTGYLMYAYYRDDDEKAEGAADGEREEAEILPSKEEYLKFAENYKLTKRETEIGFLLLHGYSNLQLAEELYISVTTVKKHLTHIYEKTGTGGRKELKTAFLGWMAVEKTG